MKHCESLQRYKLKQVQFNLPNNRINLRFRFIKCDRLNAGGGRDGGGRGGG